MPRRAAPRLRIVPFVPGRRPGDEALAPGRGCSEHVDYLDSGRADAGGQELWLLYEVDGVAGARAHVELSAWLLPSGDGDGEATPVPALQGRRLPIRAIVRGDDDAPRLADAALRGGGQRLVAALPCRALLSARAPADPEPFGFVHLFHRRVRVELRLVVDGAPAAIDACEVEVHDAGRMGSLYRRLLERLLPADIAGQGRGDDGLTVAYHPWYPVLTIGMTKAELYMRAILQDLDDQTTHLPDPRWLLRVGNYLEWLTFLGIAAALGDAGRELLSDDERRAVAGHPAFAAIRARLRPGAWREVCGLRAVAPARPGPLRAGPVGLDNLLRKERATLGFLHVHHEDLKAAIELAGPNLGDAQEAWHRVFRDAERAVLRRVTAAFPELGHLPPRARDFLLWHRRGDFRALGGAALPGWLTGLFGDQDGLFASACARYRASMNEVAAWSKGQGLMDYTGDDCVPREVSLIEARMAGAGAREGALQRGDGYGGDPARSGCLQRLPRLSAGARETLLRRAPLLAALPPAALARLAARAFPHDLAAHERVVLQGVRGDSLFVVADGAVEVLARRPDRGHDQVLATLGAGQLFGEQAVLTASPRAATVRGGGEGALVLEIAGADLRPLFAEHPELVVALAMLCAERRPATGDAARPGLRGRLARWLGAAEARA